MQRKITDLVIVEEYILKETGLEGFESSPQNFKIMVGEKFNLDMIPDRGIIKTGPDVLNLLTDEQLEKLHIFISSAFPGAGGAVIGLSALLLWNIPATKAVLLAAIGSGTGGLIADRIERRIQKRHQMRGD